MTTALRAMSLLGVFVVAKGCILAGRSLPLSSWTPIAYLWQDALVVLLFTAMDRLVRKPWIGWTLYGLATAYAALNVPVARVLSTPLTWPLLRAAGGPLADSILLYATLANVLCIGIVLLAGMGLPYLLRNLRPQKVLLAGALVLPCLIVLGPTASSRVETLGLHRNALAALVRTALPHMEAIRLEQDWRTSPFPTEPGVDLTRFRGSAAGCNVVLIALESTAAQYLGLYGAAVDPMPHISRLAEQAIVFEHAYTPYPESIKGLLSVLCSTYPAFDTTPEHYAHLRTPSLAQLLTQAGYQTALFHSGRFRYLGMEAIVRNRGFATLEDAGAISGEHQSSFGIEDERLTVRHILRWVDHVPAGQRFLLTYLPIAGHHPYNTPEPGPFPEDPAIDRYRNALNHADAAIGELLHGFRERGLDRNTLFILYGDHGEAFGQHEGNFAHTLFIYDENVRVPFLIAAPDRISAQVRASQVVSLVDVAPTILDLLGLLWPDTYQGSSVLDGRARIALFFTDYSLGLVGLRDGPWKLIYELDTDRTKLFHLATDPGEQSDRATEQPDRVVAYREHVLRWSRAQKSLLLR